MPSAWALRAENPDRNEVQKASRLPEKMSPGAAGDNPQKRKNQKERCAPAVFLAPEKTGGAGLRQAAAGKGRLRLRRPAGEGGQTGGKTVEEQLRRQSEEIGGKAG